MLKAGEYRSEHLDESAEVIKHPSGLTVIVSARAGAPSTFAGMATRFGSVDTAFKAPGDAEITHIDDGTAHFLEHKLFDSEQGDAFTLFAGTGASANAFTNFDRTVYYFTAGQNAGKSLEILLGFVTAPYFTEKTVAKEQGIIGQEIKMYEDLPGWRVMFNLLEALYINNSVKIDIAGTVDTIAKITPEKLMKIYGGFYNLSNMVLAVAGDMTTREVLALCDKCLKPATARPAESIRPEEPEGIARSYTEQKLAVGMPMFALGYKNPVPTAENEAANIAAVSIIKELVVGKGSRLYGELYDAGLITSEFSADYFCGRGFAATLFEGESPEPEKVAQKLRAEVRRLRAEGIADADFERVRAGRIGSVISSYNSVEWVGLNAIEAFLGDKAPYEYAEAYIRATKEQVEEALRGFDEDRSALSVILPNK